MHSNQGASCGNVAMIALGAEQMPSDTVTERRGELLLVTRASRQLRNLTVPDFPYD